MINVVALIRVSTKEQGESGLGLEAQEAAIRKHAAASGLNVIECYREVISGAAPFAERTVLLQALNHACTTSAHLLVAKRDRMARDPLTALLVERQLAKKYLRVLCVDGNDADDPTSKLVRGILDSVGEFERCMISARTKAAMKALADRGVTLGRPKRQRSFAIGDACLR